LSKTIRENRQRREVTQREKTHVAKIRKSGILSFSEEEGKLNAKKDREEEQDRNYVC
jgi:hypothetical protein